LSVLPSVADSNYPCGVFILLVNVFSVLPSVTDSNYPCGVFILLVNVFSVLHSVTDSNYPCGIFKLIYQKFKDTLITLSLRLKGSASGCHYNSIYNDTGAK
jgi:hypothetical protein